jgi:hypothetical protein
LNGTAFATGANPMATMPLNTAAAITVRIICFPLLWLADTLPSSKMLRAGPQRGKRTRQESFWPRPIPELAALRNLVRCPVNFTEIRLPSREEVCIGCPTRH